MAAQLVHGRCELCARDVVEGGPGAVDIDTGRLAHMRCVLAELGRSRPQTSPTLAAQHDAEIDRVLG